MFLANIDEAERTEESADDITAALTAPKPKNATHWNYLHYFYEKIIFKVIFPCELDP